MNPQENKVSSSPTPVLGITKNKLPLWSWGVLVTLFVIAVALAIVVFARLKPSKQAASTVTHNNVSLLRVGIYEAPFETTWYPNMDFADFPTALNNQVFEGLTTFKNSQVVPDLATSWTNPNTDTWVFKLAQGVKFHDGTTMTATQVAASINDNLTNPGIEAYTEDIKTAVATDPDTVTITTTQPDAILTKQLTQIWIYDTSSSTPDSASTGTGPYDIKAGTTFTSSLLQLEAFSGYHGAKPTVQEIDFSAYQTVQSQLTALKDNKLDLADLADSTLPATLNTVKADGYSLYQPAQGSITFLVPNVLKKGSPIQNLKVRQAIYDTVDPIALASARNGTGTPATQLVSQLIPGYNPSIVRPTINLSAAKTLLTQAGYANGLSLTFTYYSPLEDKLATVLQQELAPIGITLQLNPITVESTYYSDVGTGDIGDLTFLGGGSGIADTSDIAGEVVIDSPEFSDPTIDAIYTQASETFNATARLKLLQQLNADIVNELAIIPLYQATGFYWAVKPNLALSQTLVGNDYTLNWPYIYSTTQN